MRFLRRLFTTECLLHVGLSLTERQDYLLDAQKQTPTATPKAEGQKGQGRSATAGSLVHSAATHSLGSWPCILTVPRKRGLPSRRNRRSTVAVAGASCSNDSAGLGRPRAVRTQAGRTKAWNLCWQEVLMQSTGCRLWKRGKTSSVLASCTTEPAEPAYDDLLTEREPDASTFAPQQRRDHRWGGVTLNGIYLEVCGTINTYLEHHAGAAAITLPQFCQPGRDSDPGTRHPGLMQ